MTHKEFVLNAYQWGLDRDLYKEASAESQAGKYLEELGELQAAINKGHKDKIADELCDVVVTATVQFGFMGSEFVEYFADLNHKLFNGCNTYGNIMDLAKQFSTGLYSPASIYADVNSLGYDLDLNLDEARQKCWDKIKDRKGKFIDGVYVKESDL